MQIQSLMEAKNIPPDVSARIDSIVKSMLKTGYIDVCVRRLEDEGLTDAGILDVLTPHADKLVNLIISKKHKTLPGYTVYELLLLLGIGARWPSLIAALTGNKESVIKYILTQFKEHSNDDIEMDIINFDIKVLQGLGVDWPELTVIKKSVEKELVRMGHPPSLMEAQPVIPQKLIKIFNRHLNNIYERGIDKLAYLIIEMKNAGATDQQIASLLSEKRQEIVKILRNTIHNESPKNWRAINEFAVAIASLLDLGIKWPPLLELLNYYRDKIEAWAIAAVFDAGFGKHVAEKLRKFEQLGFDILPIRRAIKASTLPTLTEYLATHGIDHYTVAKLEAMHRLKLLPKTLDDKTTKLVFDAIENSMSKGMPNDFKNALKYFAMMNIPNLESTVKSIVEANKTPVIKSLLTAMKTGLGNANNYYTLPTYYIVDTLQLLHKLGIQWPELAAITRSLKAGR